MNKNDNEQIEQAWNTFVGRVFTLGGSLLFFIGSFIAVIVGYQTYKTLVDTENN